MCDFFSFVHDGRKIYYFSAEQRKNGVKMPDGNKVGSWDSHSSITCYYGLDDDGVNKFEYNPYRDKLTLDGKTVCTWDEAEIRRQLSEINWLPLAGDVQGMRGFLAELKAIPWRKPDGSLHDGQGGIRLYETRYAARNAAMDAARNAAWDAAADAARNAAWYAAADAAMDAAWNAAWYAARNAAMDATWVAAWYAASTDAARNAALYAGVMYTCAGLGIEEKHIEHVQKRMDVWRHGYNVAYDANGVLYCYERV